MSRLSEASAMLVRCLCGLALVAALVAATLRWTDLTPRVERDFFFATGSGALEQAERIESLFERHFQLVVIAEAPDIASAVYRTRIADLEAEIVALDGILASQSLASGPSDLEDARESPLWRRLLLAGDESATHLLFFVRDPWPPSLIPGVEAALARHERSDFALTVGGVPYTVAVMQRKLVRDFTVFSVVAIGAFGLASLVLFRSWRVALGVVATCTAAVAITFLVLQASGASLGLLSANLVTIVFVLTQSHLVFLTSNWRRLDDGGEGWPRVGRALRKTLRPSLGSMATTLLGFGTLLFVEAKPLRELGLGGVVGGAAAFGVAYLLFPLFLAGPAPGRGRSREPGGAARALMSRHPLAALGLVGACLLAGVGLVRLDTDPSLLAYFDEDGEIHHALAYLDRHAGSTPFEMVLRRADGAELLAVEDGYEALWRVHQALEAQPGVGRIVSLPVVLAEGERHPLAFLVPKEWMLRLLESPLFDRVGASFVSEDQRHTIFAMQMVERERETTRVEVVERLRGVARGAGFEVPLVGGVYYLQGKLSELVARSMLQSLAALSVLFIGIAWVTSGSLRVGIGTTLVLALVPLGVFGAMGFAGVPLDVVTAPAASIGLGLAADTMLHLVAAARRASARSEERGSFDRESWAQAIRSQWTGVARVSLIVALGFGLFAFSEFPPTRRFGLAVAAAVVVAAFVTLLVLPLVGSAGRKRAAG